jgi:hypothetical protein
MAIRPYIWYTPQKILKTLGYFCLIKPFTKKFAAWANQQLTSPLTKIPPISKRTFSESHSARLFG